MKWIKVSERFPLDESDLIDCNYKSIEILMWNGKHIYQGEYQIGKIPEFWGYFDRKDVTHWLIPEPPEDES